MKKVIMLVMVAFMTLAVSQKAHAIEDPNRKGTTAIGLRAGFLPGFGASATVDYTLVNNWWKGHFTVGGYAGFNASRYKYYEGVNADYTQHFLNFGIMPRAAYGLNITKDFEVHAGVMMGAALHHYSYTYHNDLHGEVEHHPGNDWYFCHGEFVGARYYFTPNFGVEAEANYSNFMSYLNVGFTFKF